MAGHSAAYGQACLGCFKTKCKCIPRPEGNGCERCHRLKRPCHPADALRRSAKKQSSSDARIAKLEGTLGQLVSLLQADNVNVGTMNNVHGNGVDPPPPIIADPDEIAEGTGGSGTMENSRAAPIDGDDEDTDANITGISGSWWAVSNTSSVSANGIRLAETPSLTVSEMVMSPSVSPSSASISVDTFRSRMLHHFPIVHLPVHLTAEQLQLNRPFLFRAIICVTSASAEEKRASSLELKRVLCETAFLKQSPQKKQQQPHQTVDMLLALLVYISWGWEHLHSRQSLSRLMGVAISLVGELHFLDQAAPEIAHTISQLELKSGFDGVYGRTSETTATTAATRTTGAGVTNSQFYLEHQRAILGCFVLGSAVSAYFSQIDAPRWIPQMDEGLAALIASGYSAGAECPSDAALAIQVRLQLLAMKAAQVRERAQLPGPPSTGDSFTSSSLTLMGQLQELRASIPPAFQQHFVLLAQTYYTEMCIIETIHIQDPARPQPPICGPTRISCFWQSALAIKSCTSTFLTLSPSGLLGVSFVQWAQLARCVATLHQLSTLQEPGWDLATLRSLVDLPVLLSCTADKLERAAAEAGEHRVSVDGVFTQLARGLRMFQSGYHGRIPNQQEEVHKPKEAGGISWTRAGADTATVATAEADTDALANGQQAEYLSPTSWLDRFFDYEDQTMT
ncbi:uncharacterized protein N7487_002546 [Penicillium crustosum]|uniref:uncharacterized protein n=1 Tax=Penicillium crustosum TaxID=36656 RepID=UPI002392194A|nr:uncharacterized protein N7487_002546 [Penicillium crustosum]KAJ5418996.1 hypothetical protein N7487_002546 [Penicillium crustosum]